MMSTSYMVEAGVQKIPSDTAVTLETAEQLIVKFRPVFSERNISTMSMQRMSSMNATAALALEYKRALPDKSHVLKLPYEMDIETAKYYVDELEKRFDVEYAEIDKRVYPTLDPNDPAYTGGSFQQYLHAPTATLKSALNFPSAWDETTGSTSIIIGIVDTGILEHTDLNDRIVQNGSVMGGYDFISDASAARDGDGRDADPRDLGDSLTNSSWHGTFVAGILGAETNTTPSQGMAGVDWSAKILPLRVLGLGGGFTSDIVDAIYWAIGDVNSGITPANPSGNRANVINMSLGGNGPCSSTEQAAINAAVARGVVVVVAAGNESTSTANVSPANCNNVITVASLDSNGSKASFSNFGSEVDISTLGVGLYSTSNTGTSSPSADTFLLGSGTSFSTPLVSGVVSLMLASNPSLTNGTIPASDVVSVIESKLKASTQVFPSGSNCTTTTCGSGMVDASAAVLAVKDLDNSTDSDGDGVLDYQDDSPSDNTLATVVTKDNASEKITIDSGVLQLTGISIVDEGFPVATGKPSSSAYTFSDGLIQYTVSTGGAASITVAFTFPSIPSGSKIYKTSVTGWTEITATSAGCTASISGNTVTLTIIDGGACDSDSTVGTITDPIGVGIPVIASTSSSPVSSSGGGGGGSLNYTFLLFLATLIILARREDILKLSKKHMKI